MIETEIRQLLIFDGETLSGFVTDEAIIHRTVMERWGETKVEEIMTKDPFTVEKDEPIGVLALFREQCISHVPVVDDGKLVGMISIHDIIEHVFQPVPRQKIGERAGKKVHLLSVPAKGIMAKPVITVLPETKLRDAEMEMHKFDISSLVIIRKGRPVGIVTKRDFLELIVQMEMVDQRLTVQFSIKDVEIDEVDSFARRYERTLEAGTLFVYMKTHGTNFKGRPLVHCRLQLRTRKGSFFGSSEGWGAQQTFRIALDKLERQIMRSKESVYEQEFVRTYLRRTQFPLTEL